VRAGGLGRAAGGPCAGEREMSRTKDWAAQGRRKRERKKEKQIQMLLNLNLKLEFK
jgi:hypothetical protein